MLARMCFLTAIAALTVNASVRSITAADLHDSEADAIHARIAELDNSLAELQHWRHHHNRPARRAAKFYSGYSFLFAKLHYHESFQALVTNFGSGTANLVPFENSFKHTPRVWLGYQAENGIGLRTTYWNFDHAGDRLTLVNDGVNVPSATTTTTIFPATITTVSAGDVLTVDSSLQASTLDLEGTWNTYLRGLDVTLGGGLRYARARQDYNARTVNAPNPFFGSGVLDSRRSFEALGPTASAQAILPWRNTGFYGLGEARVSFLFGEKTLTRNVVNNASGPGSPTVRLVDADEVTGIYGIALGGGWRRRWNQCEFFCEGLYEGQLWTSGGAPTLTFSGFEGLGLNLGLTLYR